MPTYVQHEVLGRIPDVFNAEAIWQAPGLALFSRRPLLRDLLERCPREHKGRAATRCFSHVTLMLPQEEVDDDYHLTRGAKARDLAQTLTALHQKDFGDLLGSDDVRYDVVGAGALAPGQIEVKFGHAVYLPAPDEKILYNVSASRDSAIWTPVCPIYPNQRLALIGAEGSDAGVTTACWPFGPSSADGAILIINDGADAPPIVQMRPKDAFDCRYDPRSGYFTIKSTQGALRELGAGERLMLKITRVGPATVNAAPTTPSKPATQAQTATAPAVWQSRGAAVQALDPTAVPLGRKPINKSGESDATYAPMAQQRVSLVALALPRLSRYHDTGATALELPFNQGLSLSDGADKVISFTVTAADELYACTDAGRQRITAPATFTPVDARAITLLPAAPAMADRYCATLCLAQPISAPVNGGARFIFGRSSAMLAALRVLDSPRYLQRAGAEPASADRIGLSRNAFNFEAAADGFKIGRLSASQALYHLDDKLQFVASIGDAGADAPYLLPSGHHLVAGHYVLRFDA